MEILDICGKEYRVLRLLGKGKGGYSYLVTDGTGEYVLKQIHHEPCDYYQFGDKKAPERRMALRGSFISERGRRLTSGPDRPGEIRSWIDHQWLCSGFRCRCR